MDGRHKERRKNSGKKRMREMDERHRKRDKKAKRRRRGKRR